MPKRLFYRKSHPSFGYAFDTVCFNLWVHNLTADFVAVKEKYDSLLLVWAKKPGVCFLSQFSVVLLLRI